jgi:hypothetical protein
MGVSTGIDPVLDSALFNGDFSSFHELHLFGVFTDFPWKNLSNLRVVDLRMFFQSYRTTQILDFLESAPLLHTVSFLYPMEDSSDASPEQIVTPRHLKTCTIEADDPPSILLHHLHIPSRASLTSVVRNPRFRTILQNISEFQQPLITPRSISPSILTGGLYDLADQVGVFAYSPAGTLLLIQDSLNFFALLTQSFQQPKG